jgi:hypothetical protein
VSSLYQLYKANEKKANDKAKNVLCKKMGVLAEIMMISVLQDIFLIEGYNIICVVMCGSQQQTMTIITSRHRFDLPFIVSIKWSDF